MIYDHPEFDNHQHVHFIHDQASGLKAIHATHWLKNGSGCGGIRCRPYATDIEALGEVLHLSRTMTYKSLMCNAPLGGAKTVIIGEPSVATNPAAMKILAEYIDSLQGAYVCAPDIGTNSDVMDELGKNCNAKYVAGMTAAGGTTAIATAWALLHGLKGVAQSVFKRASLEGLSIAVQGVGGVGSLLAEHLVNEGVELYLCDIDGERAKQIAQKLGAKAIDNADWLTAEVDILSPNAVGGVFNHSNHDQLRCKAICGAANTQLVDHHVAPLIAQHGIAWIPDFVVSPGGIIDGMRMVGIYTEETAQQKLIDVEQTVIELVDRAQQSEVTQLEAAEAVAHQRMNEAS